MAVCLKEEEITKEKILKLAKELKNGKLIVFPTDTVYGIGTNAYNQKACEKVYEVKGRPKNKPLSILIADISMLKEIVKNISPMEQKLINNFWPGPLTIKFKKKENVFPDSISSGDPYIRIRLINDGITAQLIKTANVPLVAPSANLSGSLTGTKIENIRNELEDKVDYILDYGNIKNDNVSIIVQVEEEKVLILREGIITKEEISTIIS